jgi:predicted RNA methylase
VSAFETAAVKAVELDDEAAEVAAHASAGLAALDQGDSDTAEARLRRVDEMLATGTLPPWFAGRELADVLAVRVAAAAGHTGLATERFERAFAVAEPNDAFAAASLVAEVAPTLAGMGVRTVEATIERARYAAIASGFDRLVSKLSR